MSHTIQNLQAGIVPTFTMVDFTIVNYTSGGEPFTLAELGIPSTQGGNIMPLFNLCTSNSLGVALVPVFIPGSGVRLFQVSGGVFSQIPTTAALNAVCRALIVWQ